MKPAAPAPVLVVLLLCASLMTAPSAFAEERLAAPGWAWARFRHPEAFERRGGDHLVADLIAEQALRLLPAGLPLQPEAFVRLDLKGDNQALDHDNRLQAAGGVRLRLRLDEHASLFAGLAYRQERRWHTGAHGHGPVWLAGWNGWWRLHAASGRRHFDRAELSTWGRLQAPYGEIGEDRRNTVAEAGLKLDIRLLRLADGLGLVKRLQLEASADTRRRDHRNWLKPSAGLLLAWQPRPRLSFELGVRAAGQWRHRSGGWENGWSAFAIFSSHWDLAD